MNKRKTSNNQSEDDGSAGFVGLRNFGALNSPDGYGKAVNHCGETMEVYLRIRNSGVSDALFFSNGCLHTLQAGSTVMALAEKQTLRRCMAITSGDVREAIRNFPADHDHCIRQALAALKKALRDYAVRGKTVLPEKSALKRAL